MNDRSFVLNRSAVTYDAQMREWLAQYKYRGDERYAPLLVEMMLRAYTMFHREGWDSLSRRCSCAPRKRSISNPAIKPL
ncbi:hypothetical protein ACQKI4_30135 [Paenibacillus glucanolyticus]|uniref:hypothetical protein n=1 Tax=Paenibacillus glucanolyticus TaxID=59843 RepID=UPI003D00F3AA